jgi:hypothetical protein
MGHCDSRGIRRSMGHCDSRGIRRSMGHRDGQSSGNMAGSLFCNASATVPGGEGNAYKQEYQGGYEQKAATGEYGERYIGSKRRPLT